MTRGRAPRAGRWAVTASLAIMLAASPVAVAAPVQHAPGDLSWTSTFGIAVPRTYGGITAAATHGGFIGAAGVAATYGEETDPWEGPPLLAQDALPYGIDATNGHAIWSSTYAGPADTSQYVYGVALSPDGSRMFVVGAESPKDTDDTDALVLAYDAATGGLLWEQRFGDETQDRWAQFVAVTPDGSTVVVGGSGWENSKPPVSDGIGGHFLAIALDAGTGAIKWHREFQHKTPGDFHMDTANGMALSPDGSQVVLAGGTNGRGTGIDYVTIAYATADGTRSWIAFYDGPGTERQGSDQDTAKAVVYSPDGSEVVVTGDSGTRHRGYEFATLAYGSSDGKRLWRSRYDGPAPGNTSDVPTGIAFAPDGSQVYVTGSDQGFLSTLALDPSTGGRLWVNVRPYRTGGGEMPDIGLATDPEDGTILMGGQVVFKYELGARALSPVDGTLAWSSSTPPAGAFVYMGFSTSSDAVLLLGGQSVDDPVNGNSEIPAITSYSTVP